MSAILPPHLAEAVVTRSADGRVREELGQQMLRAGQSTPGEVARVWSPGIAAHVKEWLKARG